MLILGIETATPWGSVALLDDDQVVLEVSLKAGKGGGEYLLALLDRLIRKAGASLAEVRLIAVGNGPGSYTGIRVGLAAVQGLAAALQIPVAQFSTLRIMAENGRAAAEWVASLIDARRGDVYAALYQRTPEGLREIIAPEAVAAAEFRQKLAALPEVLLCGDGGKSYAELWREHGNLRIGPPIWDRPLASQAGLLGLAAWRSGETLPPDRLGPSYLRRVEAEVRLEERIHGHQS
ncbi:tRNA threonylcarbamoyladenosine biosynthesis protein TsaB [Hydrogenispora ethanolica]|jgi:tRNA threonylcarbamoyladenosine biosynthesis protein TsaB|uniref:tRNA threonylcarbamoyladenosine biosynthesis protein TsaB n=1 Tax=Hydrogenispora ethanolica TaxID=1082276 RepID=A0A4R1S2T3_HYDET|nr:tRNA (adenosine(37)-N6)-threonylcarbamoyltransferase complex dimerization subunit type 1 TsaB [Hydrogenispora ethanolica]TCL73214.1 tRNA threonylcarbamoyladenosine biosynthesis protein TsaB [Hydrogenispora ethanolica]